MVGLTALGTMSRKRIFARTTLVLFAADVPSLPTFAAGKLMHVKFSLH
jgi:hypothetical protein